MNDNDIIKTLECLKGYALKCKDCPYSSKYAFPYCQQKVASDARALINRQKAEIERLKGYVTPVVQMVNAYDLLNARKEAIKEFAEYILSLFPSDKNFTTISRFSVKRKAKEMVGVRE